jgi:nitrous oxide reductase accessory protein NosL
MEHRSRLTGPTAQVFFPAEAPHGREGPAWFDSTWEAYQYVYEQEQEPVAWFVTDYSAVEPAVTVDDGVHTIAREVHAQSFRAAEAVSLVADSRVVGAMGRDLIGFGERDDAVAFQRAHGGAITTHGAVTPALIGLLGR